MEFAFYVYLDYVLILVYRQFYILKLRIVYGEITTKMLRLFSLN
jgi:hypothetical protein